MIVCSNRWTEEVQALELDADRRWLRDNSIVIDVGSERMYQPKCHRETVMPSSTMGRKLTWL